MKHSRTCALFVPTPKGTLEELAVSGMNPGLEEKTARTEIDLRGEDRRVQVHSRVSLFIE